MKEKIKQKLEAFPLCKPIRIFTNKINEAAVAAYAGQTAYMLILSFFPFFLFLPSLLQLTPISRS